MDGSKTIRVIKRDGSAELFDETKLAAAMWTAMRTRQGEYEDARELARAVRCFLHRVDWPCVASAAVFEMTIKIMRRIQLRRAAAAMETHRQRRKLRRKRLRVIHDGGRMTVWDKSWLAELAKGSWRLLPRTARILAGEIERELLDERRRWIDRGDLINRLNECVVEYGLADAVPVSPPAPQT